MMDKIRIDRYVGRFIIRCWLTFVVCACSNEPELPAVVKGQITIGEVKASEEKNAPELFYTVCLFRSPGQGDEYTCQKIDFCTQEGIKRYSFKIDNLDMGKYKYRLFVHATPKNSETKVVGIAAATETTAGTVYDDIEVELVERDGGYVPLSKDNYAGKQDISVEQILSGNTSLKLQLQRFVGQLLFDVFKCNESKIPEDIEMTYASTLDRVKHIDLMVTGMTTRLKLSDGSVMKAPEATTRWRTTTTLEAVNYQLNIEKQDQQYIRQAEKQNAAGEPWNPRGATRLLTAYLLPTGDDGKELLKANLSFTYWDTTLASGKYDERELMLKMPSSGQKLKVMKNCYTLTNIRLTHNRIIDLSAGGDATIDTGWDK